ncbi:MAG: hypothetical protein WAN16_02680, partial [Chthoniobacterales bacterium]
RPPNAECPAGHGVACPAAAGTVPKGTKASGDAEAKADAINLKITRGMTTTPIAEYRAVGTVGINYAAA